MYECMYAFSIYDSSNAVWHRFPNTGMFCQLSLFSDISYFASCVVHEVLDQKHAHACKVKKCKYHTRCVSIKEKIKTFHRITKVCIVIHVLLYTACAHKNMSWLCLPSRIKRSLQHSQLLSGSAQQYYDTRIHPKLV